MAPDGFFLRKKPLDGCAFGYIYSDPAVAAPTGKMCAPDPVFGTWEAQTQIQK
jgi:hypothetical protein